MNILSRVCSILYTIHSITIFNNASISQNGIGIDVNIDNSNIDSLLSLLEIIFQENNDDKQIYISGGINQIFTISNIISISIIPNITNNNYFMIILKMTSVPTIYFKGRLALPVILPIKGVPSKHLMDLTKYNINGTYYKYVWPFTKEVDV